MTREQEEALAATTVDFELARSKKPTQPSAAEHALDQIAAVCDCPEWDYPGQIVRDVEALANERDRLKKERDDLAIALEAATRKHSIGLCGADYSDADLRIRELARDARSSEA